MSNSSYGHQFSLTMLSAAVWNKAAGSCGPQVWGHRGWVCCKETCTHPDILWGLLVLPWPVVREAALAEWVPAWDAPHLLLEGV